MTARGETQARGASTQRRFKHITKLIQANRFNTHMMRSFDWPFFILVMAIALFGVVCIFCATETGVL